MPTYSAIRSGLARARVVVTRHNTKIGARVGSAGRLRGICLGGPTTPDGSGFFGRPIIPGIAQITTDGDPGAPCLQVLYKGFHRFRWSVKAGTHTISVLAKQPVNIAPYPSIVVKANSAVGLASDARASASGGSGWSTIGPLSLTFTAPGVVWVQLWNNCGLKTNAPAYFDHLVLT